MLPAVAGQDGAVKYALWWLLAAVVATTVGVLGVTWTVDDVRIRGPLGDYDAIRTAQANEVTPRVDPDDPVVEESLSGEWGTFVVACRGVYASTVETRPNRAARWRVISVEPGPDDDVDAVFANDRRAVDVEVFCNRGRPTISEVEHHTRP